MKPEGIFLVDKPAGVTSFQLLAPIKKAYNTKVGHGGTLDKFATGLMIVLLGRWTRLADLFSGLDKSYLGTVLFGEETDTLDPEGEVIRTAPVPTKELVLQEISVMQGAVQQIPPAYSAIHINGKRAWRRVRDGEIFDMPTRSIHIYQMGLNLWNPPCAQIEVHCSKGTYIRSIARDLGNRTDSAARLEQLRRLSIGAFSVEEAVTLEELKKGVIQPLQDRTLFEQLPGVEVISIPFQDAKLVRMGKALRFSWLPSVENLQGPTGNQRALLFDPEDRLAASIICKDGEWSYHFVAS